MNNKRLRIRMGRIREALGAIEAEVNNIYSDNGEEVAALSSAPVSNPAGKVSKDTEIKTLLFLLRQVFYIRFPSGNRVDETIQQELPDLWKDVYSWLEGENRPVPAVALSVPVAPGEVVECVVIGNLPYCPFNQRKHYADNSCTLPSGAICPKRLAAKDAPRRGEDFLLGDAR